MDNESDEKLSSPSFQKAIQRIRDDSSSGAAELASKALDAIQNEAIASTDLPSQNLWQHLLKSAKLLLDTHPEMAALDSVLREFLIKMKSTLQEIDSALEPTEAIQGIGKILMDELRHREEQTITNLAGYLEPFKTIITLSWSSTVFKGLERLVQEGGTQNKTIIVSESRPLLEGRSLATKLAQLGYKVDLIVDAAIGRYCHDADAAISGADAVLADGSILNKVGTYLMALSCADRDETIPFIVAATTTKFSYRSLRADYTPTIAKRPSEEVLEDWRELGVTPLNEYFEIVPARLVSVLICEKGCFTSGIDNQVKQTLQRQFQPFLGWDF
ncbi:MAG: translation initiation factor eIF-2B [Candidatus Heimdallarchaeota archaeon]